MLFLRKSNFWFFSCTTPLFYSLVCSSHRDSLILCSPSCIHKCFSSNSRQPDVPQTQPKPAVPAPPEAAPVAKSWANTKPGGQDGECCSGWRGSALDIRLRLCWERPPHSAVPWGCGSNIPGWKVSLSPVTQMSCSWIYQQVWRTSTRLV